MSIPSYVAQSGLEDLSQVVMMENQNLEDGEIPLGSYVLDDGAGERPLHNRKGKQETSENNEPGSDIAGGGLAELLRANFPEYFCHCGAEIAKPHTLIPCGHNVCEECAVIGGNCPVCDAQITGAVVNELVARTMAEEEVMCPFCPIDTGHIGCRWTGTYDELRSHLAYDCTFAVVNCPNKDYGCKEMIPRRLLDGHLKTCQAHPLTCPRCHETFNRADIRIHDTICAQRLRRCPDCKQFIPRGEMAKHKASQCPERKMVCPITGCGEVIYFKNIANHLGMEGALSAKHQIGLSTLAGTVGNDINDMLNEIVDLRGVVSQRQNFLYVIESNIAQLRSQIEQFKKDLPPQDTQVQASKPQEEEAKEQSATEERKKIEDLIARYAQMRKTMTRELGKKFETISLLQTQQEALQEQRAD